MNFEIFMSYVCIGLVVACVYYSFKIVECLVRRVIEIFASLYKPKPNRRRHFKNINEMFQLSKAACLFGFPGYDK